MQRMTKEEIAAQERLVSLAARATDFYSEEELEAFADEQRRKEQAKNNTNAEGTT